MPIDTSIYGQIQQPNPMQSASNAVGLAGQITQTKQAQQQLQARQGLSDAYAQATDPTTGQVDRSKLSSIVSQDPRTAWMTADVQQGANTAAQGAQMLDQNTWSTAVQKQNYAYQLASSLSGSTPDQARSVFQHARDVGLIPPDQEAQLEASIPTDPAQMGAWSQGLQQRTMSGLDQLHAYSKQLGFVNNGGQTLPYQTNPNAPGGVGPMAGAQPIQNTLTPGEQGALVQVQQPDGSMKWVPAGQVRAASGAPVAQGGSGYTGRPAQPMTAANAPATTIGQQAGATQSAQVYTNDQAAGNAAPTNIANLQAARDAIVSAGGTGPGTAGLNNVKSWLVSHGMAQGDADKVASYDEAMKLMTQYANTQSAGMGTGTDARLDAAIKGNPNPALSTKANVSILDRNMALEKMAQDRQVAFQASGLTPDKYQSWLPTFQKTHGIAVYQFDSLTPDQQGAYLKSLTPQQRANWASGYSDFQSRNGAQ